MNVIPKKIKRNFNNLDQDDNDIDTEDIVDDNHIDNPVNQNLDKDQLKETKSELSSSIPVKNEDLFNVQQQNTPKQPKGKKKKILSEKQKKHMERIRALALKKRQEKRRIKEEAKSIKQKEKEARNLQKRIQREEQLKKDKLLIEQNNKKKEDKIKAESEIKRQEQLKIYEQQFEDYFEKRYQQRRAKEIKSEREQRIQKKAKKKKKVKIKKVQQVNTEPVVRNRKKATPQIRLCPYTGRLIYS